MRPTPTQHEVNTWCDHQASLWRLAGYKTAEVQLGSQLMRWIWAHVEATDRQTFEAVVDKRRDPNKRR